MHFIAICVISRKLILITCIKWRNSMKIDFKWKTMFKERKYFFLLLQLPTVSTYYTLNITVHTCQIHPSIKLTENELVSVNHQKIEQWNNIAEYTQISYMLTQSVYVSWLWVIIIAFKNTCDKGTFPKIVYWRHIIYLTCLLSCSLKKK